MKLLRDMAIIGALILIVALYFTGYLSDLVASGLAAAIILAWLYDDMRRQRRWREEREAKMESLRRRKVAASDKDTET